MQVCKRGGGEQKNIALSQYMVCLLPAFIIDDDDHTLPKSRQLSNCLKVHPLRLCSQEEAEKSNDNLRLLPSTTICLFVQLLMRDLRRVQSDVFALERRLEDALEEERQLRQAFEADRQMQEEQKLLQQALLAAETAEKQQDEQNEAPERWHESDNGSRRGIVLSDDDSAEDWSLGRDGEDGASKEADEVGAMPQPEEGSLENDQSVDFVGEDEEDNFWQQIGIPQVERIGVVESEDPEEKPETG